MYLTSKKLDVKLFLWGLFLLQIFLISVFLAFGTLLAGHLQQDDQQRDGTWFNVKFIANRSSSSEAKNQTVSSAAAATGGLTRIRHPRFKPLRVRTLPKPAHQDKYFRSIRYHDGDREQQRLCFIEGTHFPPTQAPRGKPPRKRNSIQAPTKTLALMGWRQQQTTNETESETGELELDVAIGGAESEENEVLPDGRCRCLPEWHGPDCGQPESLWRAFVASRIPPRNQTAAPRKVPKNVFYIIDTNFISVEVLEMQIMELLDIVSLFVLCDRQLPAAGLGALKSDMYSIGEHMERVDFLKQNQNKILLLEDASCSGRNIFRKMKKFIASSDMRAEDILLYSRTDEVLNRRAVNYFRWYDNWPQPVRFRLKYNMFGFFWQHPDHTRLGSAACQLSYVDEAYRSDPEALLRIDKPVMLIGDLNHYGGWFCRLCYQPIDIVKYLEFIALVNTSSSKTNQSSLYLPDPKKGTVLNVEYVQNLIASGKHFHGNTNLVKLQRHLDKYYAPEYVRNNSWKFDNVVINLFARWEDSVVDDEYFS
ncbi:beta-1,4-mannosyl-glycoprotein 4-beta-N-acetylglucosaminyltransferase [Uranotaenia lowii]|uniref:beta-1,4-mannosyl-glycoprotein 4-beta-N-acetylglucosaminyltransferase n=1 Tax=Uranotaenia lowii TaxID=190385 RepID=UPI00247B085B|nr:beta-1,4-mannosyl-glycoprotein 4-beta-N-acetylglucosaminyltransferase [Uranotaenia lowii]